MKTEISIGYVNVYVPVYDGENTQRTISFPYIGKKLYGAPILHWTAKRYINDAKIYAAKALARNSK